jgi:hypothetical protein
MLAGDNNEVKPDRHICRFLQVVLDRRVSQEEAVSLIRQASEYFKNLGFANVTPRLLDHLIWRKQRQSKNTSVTLALNTPTKPEPHSRPSAPPRYISPSDGRFPFEEFWERCRKGGTIQNLTFSVDEDEGLCIRSSNCTSHQMSGKPYRIKRSTVKKNILQIDDSRFRMNHGWFCKVFDFIMSSLCSEQGPR